MRTDVDGAIVQWLDRDTRPGPLADLRVGVKDLLAVAGVVRLAGLPPSADDVPADRDAEVVSLLASAGAQLIATTTTHQLGYGVTTPGVTNPRTPERIAGGSSGGSGAAVARGLLDAAVGSDCAGSVRIPAACCGVVGFKPSETRVSRDGLLALAPTLDTVGPMARDVPTVERMLQAMTREFPPARRPVQLRIGILEQVTQAPLDPQVRTAWDGVLEALAADGAQVVRVDLPLFTDAHPAAGRILASEALRTHRMLLDNRAEDLDPTIRQLLTAAENLPQDRVLEARRTAALFRDRLTGVFNDVDALVLPTLPCLVPLVDQDRLDIAGASESMVSALTRLTGPWNLAGTPAGTVPVARDSHGGPIGIQVVARWQADDIALAVMSVVEQLVGGPWKPELATT